MLNDFQEGHRVTQRQYSVFFPEIENGKVNHNCGFGFDSDADGKVDTLNLSSFALARYNEMMAIAGKNIPMEGTNRIFAKPYVHYWENSYWEPAKGICPNCGAKVVLDGGPPMYDTQCECGQWYNSSGQEILPPEQWFGEDGRTDDTGETYTDIFGPEGLN